MRVPLIAAVSTLEEMQEERGAGLRRMVLSRLETLGEDETLIPDLIRELERLVSEQANITQDVSNWGGLSSEFAAFVTWLIQDMRKSSNSEDLKFSIRSKTQTRLYEEFSVENLSPYEHITVQNWAFGATWSKERPFSAPRFPFSALGRSSDVAVIAYEGLIEQLRLLEGLEIAEIPGSETEMLVSSVPVRVVGLAESLNPTRVDEAVQTGGTVNSLAALSAQIQKLDQPSKELESYKRWNMQLVSIRDARNAVAHLSRNKDNGFIEQAQILTREYALDLGELASTMMSAELVHLVDKVSEQNVRHWLDHLSKQIAGERGLVPPDRDIAGDLGIVKPLIEISHFEEV